MSSGPVPLLALNQWGIVSVTWRGASTNVTYNGFHISSVTQSDTTELPVGGVGVILTGGASAQWDDLTVITASTCVLLKSIHRVLLNYSFCLFIHLSIAQGTALSSTSH